MDGLDAFYMHCFHCEAWRRWCEGALLVTLLGLYLKLKAPWTIMAKHHWKEWMNGVVFHCDSKFYIMWAQYYIGYSLPMYIIPLPGFRQDGSSVEGLWSVICVILYAESHYCSSRPLFCCLFHQLLLCTNLISSIVHFYIITIHIQLHVLVAENCSRLRISVVTSHVIS